MTLSSLMTLSRLLRGLLLAAAASGGAAAAEHEGSGTRGMLQARRPAREEAAAAWCRHLVSPCMHPALACLCSLCQALVGSRSARSVAFRGRHAPHRCLPLPPLPPLLQQVLRLDDGTVVQVEEFRGPPKASALPYLFTNRCVSVHCPGRKVRAGWWVGGWAPLWGLLCAR